MQMQVLEIDIGESKKYSCLPLKQDGFVVEKWACQFAHCLPGGH